MKNRNKNEVWTVKDYKKYFPAPLNETILSKIKVNPAEITPDDRKALKRLLNSSKTYTFYITPIGKPRMTQRDKWKHRPCVDRYFAYKDELLKNAKEINFPITFPEQCRITFFFPMPKSWSEKKQLSMIGKPHKVKPDWDNCGKAISDIFCKNDSYLWDIQIKKYWSRIGGITIQTF